MEHRNFYSWGAFSQKETPTYLRHCFKMDKEWEEKRSCLAQDPKELGSREEKKDDEFEVKRVRRKIRGQGVPAIRSQTYTDKYYRRQ